MVRDNRARIFEVGNRAGHAEDFIVGPGRKPDRVHGRLEQLCSGSIEFTERANLPVRHLAVATRSTIRKSLLLNEPGCNHRIAHLRTAGAGSLARKIPK